MKLRLEERLILSCVKIQPSPEDLEEINVLIPLIRDWEYLISTIIDRGIGPLLFKKLPYLTNSSQIPESVKTKLQQVYYKTFSRSTILYEHFRKIAEAFELKDIPLIALKGIYLSEWLYQDIGLRQFSDIDLLVKEEDGEKCLQILGHMGYKQSSVGKMSDFVTANLDIVHYPPMIQNGISIEIHIKLSVKTEKYNIIISELWSKAFLTTLNGVKILALNIDNLLIHICLHLERHFRGGKVQFTCFNDITNILDNYSNLINWVTFTKTCQLYKCEDLVYLHIVMTNKYMHAKVPESIIIKYSYLLKRKDERLFCYYLKGSIRKGFTMTISNHFGQLNQLGKLTDKVKYLSGVLFPSRIFMVIRYKIKRPYLFLFYYPYRYYIGVSGVMNYLKKKVVGKGRK